MWTEPGLAELFNRLSVYLHPLQTLLTFLQLEKTEKERKKRQNALSLIMF